MEPEDVFKHLFSSDGKLINLTQITERGRTIGLAFIVMLMQDGKMKVDTKKVVKFIKEFPCPHTSKPFLKDFVSQFKKQGLLFSYNSSFAQAIFTSDNGTLTNLSQFTTIGRHFGYAFLAVLMNHRNRMIAFTVEHVMDFIKKSKNIMQLKESISEIHDFLCQFGKDGLIVLKDLEELDVLRASNQAKRDIMGALHQYPGLQHKMEKFTFNDGHSKYLICLEGTIPVPHFGSMYNIPVGIWVLNTHPAHSPMVYVRPTATMQIKVSRNVDNNGKIYLPYLDEWDGNNSNILSLIQMCILTFGNRPPVFTIGRQTENNVKDECTICCEPRHPTYLLFPCGHATFCKDCALRLSENEEKRCPDCRTTIQGTCRVFGTIGSK